MSQFLRTDEATEVFVTLSALSDFLQRASNDVYYWKWAFIALHNCVQGAMVVALRRTDGFGPIQKHIETKWYKEYRRTGEPPIIEERLLRFMELYDKIKMSGTLQWTSVERYDPRGRQDRAMRKLNDIRNDFIHFTPKGWSLEITDAPELFMEVLDVVAFLTKNCSSFWIPQEIPYESYERLLGRITEDLQVLKAKYG